jgi:hypothetical protein
MCALRRVADKQAGPAALGLLVPPGRRTFLIVRPRSLTWDLLLVRSPNVLNFLDMTPAEATSASRDFYCALLDWTVGGPGRLDALDAHPGPGYWLRACVGGFTLVVCPRRPGQPYQPLLFHDDASAHTAAHQLVAVLCPPAHVVQEVYFNTQHFSP